MKALSLRPAPGWFEDGEPPAEQFIVRKTADAGYEIARQDFLFKLIFEAAEKDKEYQGMIEAVKMDVSYKELDVGHPGREVGKLDWDKLAIMDDLPNTLMIYNSNKVFIPKGKRNKMLELLHISHGKTESMISKARDRFFGPHMRKSIKDIANTCEACAICGNKQVFEPPVIDAEHIAGLRPMYEIAVDYGAFGGKNFLVLVDRASSYAICEETKGQTTAETIKILDKIFEFFGPPRILRADDGPAFKKTFNEYLESRGILRQTSSAYNSQSNGMCELAVGRCKEILKKCNVNKGD